MQKLDFTVATGATVPIDCQGNYLRYFKATAGDVAPGIGFKTDKGDAGILYPGEAVTLARPFDQIQITNFDNVNAITGYLGVADSGEKYDAARIAGNVSVIDGSAGITKSGYGFLGRSSAAAVGGQLPHAQLFNPVASGRNAFIKKLYCYSDTGTQYTMTHYNALLTAIGNGINKKNGGAVSVCQTAGGNNAAVLGTRFLDFTVPGAVQTMPVTFEQPLEITPGQGICVLTASANQSIYATFDFYEEPV